MPIKTKKKRFWEHQRTGKAFEKPPEEKVADYNTRAWQKKRKHILLRDNHLCQHCLPLLTSATVVDHIRPVNQGGDFWDDDNLQALCASCHNAKSATERKTGGGC